MLSDTSDIVRQNRTHPADYALNNEADRDFDEINLRPWKKQRGPYHEEVASLAYERLLARPNIADNGALAPELLILWDRNSARLRGEELPFRMIGESGESQRTQLAEDIMKEAAKDEENIEIGRHNEGNQNADDSRLSMDIPEEEKNDQEEEFPQDFDEEMPNPFDAEDDKLAGEQQVADDNIIAMASPARSEESQRSSFSLGAVNDLEEEISGESRQEQGQDLVKSSSKWHKHTVKVLDMLQKNMTSDEDGKLAKELSYDRLSHNVSRRTACGVFFELLQLKTWDFIELSQEKSYSDIKIAPGIRFNETPPSD